LTTETLIADKPEKDSGGAAAMGGMAAWVAWAAWAA